MTGREFAAPPVCDCASFAPSPFGSPVSNRFEGLHDALSMRVIESPRGLQHAIEGQCDRHSPPLFDQLRQIGTRDVLHHEESPRPGDLGIQGAHDVRMQQLRRRLDLALKPLHQIGPRVQAGRQHLQCDDAFHPPMQRLVHDTHAPLPQLFQHRVAADNQRLSLPRQNGLRLMAVSRSWPISQSTSVCTLPDWSSELRRFRSACNSSASNNPLSISNRVNCSSGASVDSLPGDVSVTDKELPALSGNVQPISDGCRRRAASNGSRL